MCQVTNDVEADEASHVQGADGVGAGCLAQAAAEQSPDHPRLCTIPVLLNSQRASVTQTPESALLCSCPRRQFTGPAFGHNPCHVLVDAYEGVYQLAHHLLLDLLSTVRGVLTGGASDKFIQLLISHLEPCLIRMVRGDMVWGSNTTMVSTEMEMREAITSSSNPLCDNKFDMTNKCVSQLPIHYMATSTWKKVEPDMICEDEFDKDVFYNDDEAIAKVAVHDTGGSVLKTLFPGLVQESLPSSSSVMSGPWAKVIEYTHIHAQHSPYDTVTWQKQPKGEHDLDVGQDKGDARHKSQTDHGDQGDGDGVDVPATTPPTDSLPKMLPNWQVTKFNVFMEQSTNKAKSIDMIDVLAKGGDNKLIHDVAADDDVNVGEGFGGDEQMPMFEEIVDEPANNYQQTEIDDITDDGGQTRGGHGGEGGCIQVHGEPGLGDHHHGGQVREEGLEGNDHRGQAHADAGFEGGHHGKQVSADAGLGGDEGGGGDARPVRRRRPKKKYSADVYNFSRIRIRSR